MVTTRKERVVFIGAGNLATHLATALHGAGYDIVQIFSRTTHRPDNWPNVPGVH